MTFEEYKKEFYNNIHKSTVIFVWFGTILAFAVEVAIFIVFNTNKYLTTPIGEYILLRIVRPTSINVFSSLVCTIVVFNKHVPSKIKDYVCCISVLVCCSSIAIFHIYYQFLIFSIALSVFAVVLYGDKKLLNIISLISIIPSVIASIAFYQEHVELPGATRITCVLVYGTMVIIFYFLSLTIVKAQQNQMGFIYSYYKRQNALIQELKIEPMTHLYNKLCMEACLNSFFKKYQNDHISQAIAILDIDKFKDVNDIYGHEAGDEVLITLANTIKNEMGGIRHAFRFGGEEFVITFTDQNREQITEKITQIKDKFKSTVFEFAPDKRFSFTCGVAFLLPQMEDRSQWFNAADEAMYEGKESGRDKIVFYGD